ncbi:MAG: PDZ domain-containing protein [Phycisphaerae bacterium]|nr:PDZ domain-containing protein [Tepidisphaeraceae bacterium]
MKRSCLVVLSVIVWIGSAAVAQEAALPPAEVTKVRQLVVQLGDPDFARREEATRALRNYGKGALPYLKAALTDPDIEVVSRAQALIRKAEVRTLPGGPFDPTADLRPTRVRMSASNGARVLEVSDAQRDLKIRQSADELVITVTGDVDGERVTEEYTAKDAETLKKDNPEVYALYERWTGPGNGPGFILRGPMRIGGGNAGGAAMIIGPGIVAGPAGAPDELDLLRLRLEKQFRENKVKEADRDDVLGELNKLADARQAGDMEAYTAKSDEIRKTLEKHKLDAGDLLPPPAKSRLGVSIQQGLAADGGLMVQRVADKSRGERIGLQVGDVIKQVDGKAVGSVAELRKAVTAKEAGIVVEVVRDGRDLKLEEKGEPKK